MVDITFFGMTMEYSAIESQMDQELKAEIMQTLSDEQEILDAYLLKHKEKYGSDFLQG
ncbi:MAG: hypothetical protein R3240_03200 [Gammaproteobacteria bacterium]|nr:hypothetical protein [Gammaproteobacteria bacterium]